MDQFVSTILDRSSSSEFLELIKIPPLYTSIRLNTINHSKDHIKGELQQILDLQCKSKNWENFEILEDSEIDDMLVVPSKNNLNVSAKYPQVIVDLGCGQAVLRGADVFAPGIIAVGPYAEKGERVSIFVDLQRKCKRGFTKEFNGIKQFVGNGIMKLSRNDLFKNNVISSGIGIEIDQPIYFAPCLTGILTDLIFLQNLPSIMASHVLNPSPNDTVLDMCASPGGKTTHIATLMKNQGVIIALDKNQSKVEIINENIRRFGLTNVRTQSMDSSKILNLESGLSRDELKLGNLSKGFRDDLFDKILLDPPCSGIGQRPLLSDMSVHSVNFETFQKKLMAEAFALLKPGGRLVYSTCTLVPKENEEVVFWALDKFPLKLIPICYKYGQPGLSGYGLSEMQCKMVKRFIPSLKCDTIAFFIACFEK